MQIEFYRYLYMSESLKHKKTSLIRKIKRRRVSPGVYLIVLFPEGRGSLEFFQGVLLRQRFFETRPFLVIGIADSYEDSLYLVQKIAEDTYRESNGIGIRDDILNKQNESEEGSVR